MPKTHTDSAETQTIADARGPLGLAPQLQPGTQVGRYVVIEKVGSGGMGEVVRAYDPKLRREVAIKRLHAGALDDEGEARLLREAQAMAQLSHPNVVSVFDVDRTELGVIMAMEFVDGITMREWLQTPQPWRDVVGHMIAAARALEAAHAAGLAHRDFKPANVMLSEQTGRGRVAGVKVMDFGLARAGNEGADVDPVRVEGFVSGEHDSLSDPLTRQGVVLGTPPYMAPEQHAGASADARSDQYAFCISLWEALWGERPFRGPLGKLAIAKHEGPPPCPKGSVPRWLYDVAARGLAVSPPDRYPSMTELIAALDRDPDRTRRRVATVVVSAAALVGLGALASRLGSEQKCPDPTDELAGIWDEVRKAEVDAAIRGSEMPYADDTAERTLARIDAYAQEWITQKKDACEATHVRHELSADLLDRRTLCLAKGPMALRAVAEVLAAADDDVVERASKVVADLPPLSPCSDVEALKSGVAPPGTAALAAEVERIQAQLVTIVTVADSGHYDDAKAAIDKTLPEALALDYAPIHGRAHQVAGKVASMRGDYKPAAVSFTAAFEIAIAIRADRLAADTAISLLLVEGLDMARYDKGEAWTTTAKALAERVDPGGPTFGKVLNAEGVLRHRQARHEEAIEHFERAIEVFEGESGAEPMELGHAHNHLGASLDELRRYREAEGHFRRALSIAEGEYGPEHPGVTSALGNLALNLQFQERFDEALELQKRVLAVREAALPPTHDSIALTHNNMAWTLFELKQPEEAETHFERAVELFEGAHGPNHARVGMALEGLASMKSRLGKLDEAEALHRRSMKIRIAAVGPDHPNVASSHIGLSDVFIRAERLDEALAEIDAALVILDKRPDDGIRFLIDTLYQQGVVLMRLKRAGEARGALERCVGLLDPDHPTERDGAMKFALANALLEDGERDKAFAMAKEARTHVEDPAKLAEIDEFLKN